MGHQSSNCAIPSQEVSLNSSRVYIYGLGCWKNGAGAVLADLTAFVPEQLVALSRSQGAAREFAQGEREPRGALQQALWGLSFREFLPLAPVQVDSYRLYPRQPGFPNSGT